MTKAQIANRISRAVALDREIELFKEQLQAIKDELIGEAKRRDHEMETAGEGKRWTAESDDGCIARVNFPAASISRIDADSVDEKQVRLLVTDTAFGQLFEEKTTFAAVKHFRALLRVVAPRNAKKVLELLEKENAPRVSFETKEKAA